LLTGAWPVLAAPPRSRASLRKAVSAHRFPCRRRRSRCRATPRGALALALAVFTDAVTLISRRTIYGSG
jgi:hypothetical protein